MSMKKIHTDNAPAAIGPYTQAYKAGDLLFISGQGGVIPETGMIVDGGIAGQTEQAAKNLHAILSQAGADFSNVIKTTCFLADMNDFRAFNGVYEKYFVSKPARSCVAVRELPMGILCEIELVAYLGE